MRIEDNIQEAWFATNAKRIEEAYLKGTTPWERSGVGLHTTRTAEYWRAIRQPIADLIDRSGSVLDIGCANGYLLESLQAWLGERGIVIEPYGLDISKPLIEEAKARLPKATFINANVWGWKAERKYDFVITELEYVPKEYHSFYLNGLLSEALAHGGKLIVTQYSSDITREENLHQYLASMGFTIDSLASGEWDGIKKTAACSLTRNNLPSDDFFSA